MKMYAHGTPRCLRLPNRKWAPIAILLILLLFALPAEAQTPADSLTEMTIDIWPDYDRPSVLVLLTGRLPAETALPARVTVPIMPNATLNAVARLTSDGLMVDDIEFTTSDEAVTLTSPEARFRIEYYVPYQVTGDERSFRFDWLAEQLSVDQLAVTVQQPAVAESLETMPAAMTVSVGPDGLDYHHLPPETVLAGDNYIAEFAYTASGNLLTVSTLTGQPTQAVPDIVDPTIATESTSTLATSWPLLLAGAAGVLIFTVAGRQIIAGRRANQSARRRPRPAQRRPIASGARPAATAALPKEGRVEAQVTAAKGKVQFCHQCGESVGEGDRFCRACGTKLKVR